MIAQALTESVRVHQPQLVAVQEVVHAARSVTFMLMYSTVADSKSSLKEFTDSVRVH